MPGNGESGDVSPFLLSKVSLHCLPHPSVDVMGNHWNQLEAMGTLCSLMGGAGTPMPVLPLMPLPVVQPQVTVSHSSLRNLSTLAGLLAQSIQAMKVGGSKGVKKGLNPTAPAFKPTSKETKKEKPICHFFIRGICAHGTRCRYSHEWPVVNSQTTDLPAVVPAVSPSFYLPSELNEKYEIAPCEKFNTTTGCTDESWPHKLTHFFKERKGFHETDANCIYPEPRAYHKTCQVHPKKMWKWEPTTLQWIQATPGAKVYPPSTGIRILTYNVLFDHYMKGHIHSKKRYPALLEVLREAEFDIACLQEVQPSFLKAILREEWIRGRYWSSAVEECSSLNFSGVVILSRWPLINLAVHDLPQTSGNVSPCVIGTLPILPTLDVAVCSAHLSHSDVEIRTCQLANILRKTSCYEDMILLGDFNVHALRPGDEFVDAWIESEGSECDDDGSTLCVGTNPMAALMARNDEREGSPPASSDSGRFDIIFLKTTRPSLRTEQNSAAVGGKETCLHYLSRRLHRLAGYLKKDPTSLTSSHLPQGDSTHPSDTPAFTDADTLEEQLFDTASALEKLPSYLCPSDHYYVMATIHSEA